MTDKDVNSSATVPQSGARPRKRRQVTAEIVYEKVPAAGPLTSGAVYRRSDLHLRFGGNHVAGIVPSKREPVVLLFHTEEPAQQFYRDGLDADGVYWFSGEGTFDDMRWTPANVAVRDHLELGLDLLHFERVQRTNGLWRFANLFQYLSHRQEQRPDKRGKSRLAIIFGLLPIPTQVREALNRVDGALKADTTDPIPTSIVKRGSHLSFTPEFEGPKKKYVLTAPIASHCDHGTVVNTLHAELRSLGLNAYRTVKIDLFLADDKGDITHLIEVKTDQTTTNLYQAVGQVMLHSALEKSNPKRILVLPGEPSADTACRLNSLGIRILRYDWNGSKPIFTGLRTMVV